MDTFNAFKKQLDISNEQYQKLKADQQKLQEQLEVTQKRLLSMENMEDYIVHEFYDEKLRLEARWPKLEEKEKQAGWRVDRCLATIEECVRGMRECVAAGLDEAAKR